MKSAYTKDADASVCSLYAPSMSDIVGLGRCSPLAISPHKLENLTPLICLPAIPTDMQTTPVRCPPGCVEFRPGTWQDIIRLRLTIWRIRRGHMPSCAIRHNIETVLGAVRASGYNAFAHL